MALKMATEQGRMKFTRPLFRLFSQSSQHISLLAPMTFHGKPADSLHFQRSVQL